MSDSMTKVRKLTSEDAAEAWSKVGDHQIFVSDIIDHATVPEAKMTVGFARLGQGEAMDISFPTTRC